MLELAKGLCAIESASHTDSKKLRQSELAAELVAILSPNLMSGADQNQVKLRVFVCRCQGI